MKILIGWDIQDITPTQPVELIGQYYQRISKSVRDPLCVTALAMEQTTAAGREQVVMVSIDIVYVAQDFLEEVRGRSCAQVPRPRPGSRSFSTPRIFTAGRPGLRRFAGGCRRRARCSPPKSGHCVLDRVVRAVVNAWKARQPGRVSAASAYAPMGFSRRMLYADGSAMMYGETNRGGFHRAWKAATIPKCGCFLPGTTATN